MRAVTSPTGGRVQRAPGPLRPGLREAAHALRIVTTPQLRDDGSSHESDGAVGLDGLDGLDLAGPCDEAEEADVEAAAVAELGQLLDALSETVSALADASRSPRRMHLRRLEVTLAEASARATGLAWPPEEVLPR